MSCLQKYEKVNANPEMSHRRMIRRVVYSGDKLVVQNPELSAQQNAQPGNISVLQNAGSGNNSVQKNNFVSGDTSGQRELSGSISSQQNLALAPCCCCCCRRQNQASLCNSNQKKVSRMEPGFTDLDADLPRFGPLFGEDVEYIKNLKQRAWNHVKENTAGEEESLVDGNYRSALKKIMKEARDSYEAVIVKTMKKNQFLSMMIEDGCFFLQLALRILGGSEQHGCSNTKVYFTREKLSKRWSKAMFVVGNQLPYVVIRELMKQRFFKDVIRTGTWNLPSDLDKLALYLVVVQPELDRKRLSLPRRIFYKMTDRKEAPSFPEPPSDLLHGLYILALGPVKDSHDCEGEYFQDVEAGGEDHDTEIRFPSATEMVGSGIHLQKANGGIREIHLEKKYSFFWTSLFVPVFTWDDDACLMLHYLKGYEIGQRQGKGSREVAAYLRFMRDLIQTEKDVKILESRGILKVENKSDKDKLPRMLRRIVVSEEAPFTQNLRLTRLKVNEYERIPWGQFMSWVAIFTLLQTVFTVLQYAAPRH